LKNTFRLAVLLLPPMLVLLPPIDALFSAGMPQKALGEPLVLLFCGIAASGLWRPSAALASAIVAGATLLLLFWMIPRSIDFTQIYAWANALYAFCLSAAGFLLASGFFLLPPVGRTLYSLYFCSMLVAVGVLYSSQTTLYCSAFTLQDQHDFGTVLFVLGLILYPLAVLSILLRPRGLQAH
jgi:hypothetical protein